ncbi:MAG: F0F1 ATP synthase subunit A [Ruminococcus sp.]|nr:F0F1 ATP synthase subunit A [Ruminococcus sp.]
MENDKQRFRLLDTVYIAMMILPVLCGIILKILTTPLSEGISISGAKIFFTIKMPIQDLPITESQVHSWLVMISITGLCLFLTHGIKEKADTKRQHIAEWIVENTQELVNGNMGEYFSGFAPFIAAVLGLSAFSSLLALFGLYAPTSDVNVTAGWAILVFFLITYYKMKCGPVVYAKSFADPPLLTPLNIISEFATPVSMAFRHYGNVLSGSVISVLLAAGLQGLSAMVFGKIPGFLSEIPFFQIGIPAVLSIYFDVFSGLLQAYIFAMLTMLYVAGAFPADEYFRRKALNKSK